METFIEKLFIIIGIIIFWLGPILTWSTPKNYWYLTIIGFILLCGTILIGTLKSKRV